jgi:secreted PhoX family phosphatase
MAFDHAGNLWFTSDISGSAIGNETYRAFGHNGLFMVPRSGEQAGQVIQMASAPNDAEFTGPFFAPDKKTLFLSVQHPGERTKSLDAYTSAWPHNEDGIPRSSVICISGETLEKIQMG